MYELRAATFCDPEELVEGNPTYSVVRLPDGRESTVSILPIWLRTLRLTSKARTP